MPVAAPWTSPYRPRLAFASIRSERSVKVRAANKPTPDPSTANSPLTILTHDIDYLEQTLGLDLYTPLGSVAEAHDQMVCTLNPLVAAQRSKELDMKVQELHDELDKAHDAIHDTEAGLKESVRHLTEMEREMSKLKTAHPDLGVKAMEQEAAEMRRPSQFCQTPAKREGGIENSLELGSKLKEHWYPVEFCSTLKSDALVPLELFGEKWVLFRDEKGAAACLQDECAHRACPLSIGSVCEGRVQCPYHGWEYDKKGKCVKMPSTRFCNGISVKALPIAEADGFIWIWPGASEPSSLPECTLPPNEFQIHAELMLDVPVEHGLLLENLLDLAHAPFTHTSTFAKGWPVPDAVKFHTSKLLGGNWDPYPIDMSFETPCMVVSLIGLQQPGKIERGARAKSCVHHLHQLHVCLPTNNRQTRLLYRMSLDFLHWTRFIPGIQQFWGNVAKQVMGEDLVLVEGQQDRMLRGASVWRNPVTYDKLGIRYRRWRNATSREEREEAVGHLKTMSAAEIFSLDDQTYCS